MTTKIPFERAMADHGPTVLRVCTAVLGPGPDAEDAYSETFLSALRSWPDLADDTNVEAWLVRVAQRKAVDVIRARARHAVPSEAVPDRESTHTGDSEVWHVVAKLPERQRLAVAYHYLGGLPHAETAELTGSTPAAVRRAAADGIKALRSALADPTKDTP
ncbi:RNA polymerase sigma factor [Mycolicibacterium sp. GCM10028919]|uniref:RNA polymerase sigma factor n=1 Tax=Mycolicibacterium sp. GCM10028919 TaxID=3273401 RepID=UPI00361B892E